MWGWGYDGKRETAKHDVSIAIFVINHFLSFLSRQRIPHIRKIP